MLYSNKLDCRSRLGWTGKIAPGLTLGATWASRIDGRFGKYRGLFADNGGFDIPENFGVGVAFEATKDLTVRGGVSYATQPVRSLETFFNILAPGVVQKHLTVGATWTAPGGGNANVNLRENIIGIAYGWKL